MEICFSTANFTLMETMQKTETGKTKQNRTKQKIKQLTFNDDSPSCPVVVDHLDVSVMDVAEEDAVTAGGLLPVIQRQGDDVLEVGLVLERLHGRVEVALIRQVDALEDGALGVEQVALVALAGEAVLSQVAVGTGAGTAAAAQVEAELLAAAVATGTRVGSCATEKKDLDR